MLVIIEIIKKFLKKYVILFIDINDFFKDFNALNYINHLYDRCILRIIDVLYVIAISLKISTY